MKKCPRCGHVSFDNNQNFCLIDGETLIISNDSQPTLKFDPQSFSAASTTQKQGVSSGFAYATIGLLSLLIGGGIVALVLINPFASKTDTANQLQTAQNNQTNTANPAANSAANQQTATAFQPPSAPVVIKVPVPPSANSKSFGYKNYNGNVGSNPASFDLVWNKDKSISGSYYFRSNPKIIYNVSGSNYVDGNSDIRVSQGSDFVGEMKLNKTIEGNILCWQGYFSAGNQYVRFCRNR